MYKAIIKKNLKRNCGLDKCYEADFYTKIVDIKRIRCYIELT